MRVRSLARTVGGVTASSRRLADIGAEAALVTGGGRAILLQLANPAIGHAIARHSDFERDPLKRLRHTLTFVYALVYGSDAQRTRAIGYVNSAHKPVASSDHESPSYRATDPELQLWVAATLYDTATQVHQLLIEAERVAASSPARARDGWLRRLAVAVIIVVSILVWLRERT